MVRQDGSLNMKYKEREKEIMENRPKRDLVDYDAIAQLSRKGNFLPKPLADCRLQICHEVIEMQNGNFCLTTRHS
jgi:hypothetical protein